MEDIKDMDEDCLVFPVVITVKIALDPCKLNDNWIKMRPHMVELLNQHLVEITSD